MLLEAGQKLWGFIQQTFIADWQGLALSFLASILAAGLVLCVEVAYVGYARSGLKRILSDRSHSTVLDIAYFIAHTTGIITLAAALLSAGIPFMLAGAIRKMLQLDIGHNFPAWGHLALFLICADFLAYWQHRLMHRIPALWKIHEFHHSAEEFNTITVFREHALDRAINVVVMAVPVALLGVPLVQLPFFLTVYGAIGYVKHSQIPWHGWFGKWVIQSPRDHLIHHSWTVEHHDTNFANNFAVWDHLFGTYYKGSNFNPVLGLDPNPYNRRGVTFDTWQAQAGFVRSLLQPLTRILPRGPRQGQ